MNHDLVVFLGMPATGSDRTLARAHIDPGVAVLNDPHLLGGEPLGPADAERLRPQAEANLAAALAQRGATDARVLLPIRRQDHLMEFAHLHAVRAGSAVPFAEQFPHPRNPTLDWADLAARLAGVPGVALVELLPVEVAPEPAPPVTYSARGIRVARSLNGHLESDAERDLVASFVAEHFPGRPTGNQFLSAATRARVLEAYAAVNRRLFREWLPGLPEDAYLDDTHTRTLETP